MSLKDMPKLYLLNEDGPNPVIRALVQTPGILSYKDMDLPDFEYPPEVIQKAMNGLVGYDVEDETHNGTGDKSFATIKNAGYCPDYGGYVDLEVWKPEYHDLARNMARSIEEGIPVKRGFSTEVDVHNATRLDGGVVRIEDMDYTGLIMTKKPRDKRTGVCSVLPNKYDESKIDGSDLKMTDEDMVPKTELMAANSRYETLFKDYETGKAAYEALKAKYTEGEALYTAAQESIESLEKELEPIREAEEEARVGVLNKIIEDAPEDTQEALKAILENKSRDELEVFAKLQNKAPKGVVTPPPVTTKDKDDDDISVEDVLEIMRNR